jgi:hypothetical protein
MLRIWRCRNLQHEHHPTAVAEAQHFVNRGVVGIQTPYTQGPCALPPLAQSACHDWCKFASHLHSHSHTLKRINALFV